VSKKLVESYYSQCLQTNLPAAIGVLRSNSRNSGFQHLKRRVHRRFINNSEKPVINTTDPLVRSVISSYREYYRRALMNARTAAKFEKLLQKEVRALAVEHGIKKAKSLKWESVEKLLAQEFRRRGYFALFGRVTPFRSLLVWEKERSRAYKVHLTESTQKVKVVFLDRFLELGWLHFATFGRWYVGGWAKKDALYCVAQAYKYNFAGERFKVSYLTHEAQHFSDYKKYPKLMQADLEYRAKLAELAASQRPVRLVKKFKAEARNDRKLPHCFAAHQIIQHFDGLSGELARKRINEEARKLIQLHSKKLNEQGAKRTSSAL
jgi:hypothetical protein